MFLTDVFEKYQELKPGVRKTSIDQIRYSITAFEKWSQHKRPVEQIDTDAMAEFCRWRSKKVGSWTLSRNLSDVRALMRFAANVLRLKIVQPFVEPVSTPKNIPDAWTVHEVAALVKQCNSLQGSMRNLSVLRSAWWVAMILFLYDSGSRIRAALSVLVADFSADGHTAILRGEYAKTGVEQIVDLSPETVAAMQVVIDAVGKRSKFALPYPWSHRKLWADFHEIMEASGVRTGKYVGFHRLRKTHATQQVITHGWEHARIALGHSSEAMTKRYVDLRQIPRTPLSIARPVISVTKDHP